MNATIALIALLAAAEPSSSSSRFQQQNAIPPRDPHPFGAIETRPLWDRTPPAVRGSRELSVQGRTEDALDRSNGRVEDGATFELRQLERDRLTRDANDATANNYSLTSAERDDIDPARAERERQELLEQRRLWLERERQRGRRLERESETLAEVRRRFAAEASRADHATGAVVDQQLLAGVEADYRADVAAAARQRASSLSAIDADTKVSPQDRAARRAAAERTFEQSQVDAARRWEARRGQVLGQK